jgi:hypothetical protein
VTFSENRQGAKNAKVAKDRSFLGGVQMGPSATLGLNKFHIQFRWQNEYGICIFQKPQRRKERKVRKEIAVLSASSVH